MTGKTFAQYEKEQYDREQAVEAFRATPAYADMLAEWLEDMRDSTDYADLLYEWIEDMEDSAEFEDALDIFVEASQS